MRCPECRAEIPEESKFCLECGSDVSDISDESGVESEVSVEGLPTKEGPMAEKPEDEPGGPENRSVGGLKTGDGRT